MSRLFDIGLERLTGQPVISGVVQGVTAEGRGTFFLETFGCQMNDHDSEKVAGVLLSRGYRQGDAPRAPAMILYNKGRISGKGAPEVFLRLGGNLQKQT